MTSLLDVAFVLLLAFMMVAPSLKYGVEIDLPVVQASNTPLPGESPNTAVIAIRANSEGEVVDYHLDGQPVTLAKLEDELRTRNTAADNKLQAEVQADKFTRYEAAVQVMNAIRRAGIQGIALPVTVAGP